MTPANFMEVIDTIDSKHEEAHKRLRDTLRDHEDKIESNYQYLRDRADKNQIAIEQLKRDVENQGKAPVNIDRLLVTPKVIVTIIVAVLSIYGLFLSATGGLKSDLHDLKLTLDAKTVSDNARATLEDNQMAALKATVDDLRRQVQLLQYDNQTLKDLVRKKGS